TVETLTTAMSLRGYCRTLSARIDCSPAMRITRLTTIARTGRLTKRSVRRILIVLGLWRGFVARLDFVVHENGGTIAKLEGTGTDHLFSALASGEDGDLITARRSKLHDLLPHTFVGLTICVLQLGDHVYGVAVWRVADGGSRQRHQLAAGAQQYFRLNEHAGTQRAFGIRQRGLYLNVPG